MIRRLAAALAVVLAAGAAAAQEAWIVFAAGEERLEVAAGDVAEATLGADYSGEPALYIRFEAEAAQAFGALTSRIIGLPLEVRRGDDVLMAPYVREPILGGAVQITGPEEAELRAVLNALAPE